MLVSPEPHRLRAQSWEMRYNGNIIWFIVFSSKWARKAALQTVAFYIYAPLCLYGSCLWVAAVMIIHLGTWSPSVFSLIYDSTAFILWEPLVLCLHDDLVRRSQDKAKGDNVSVSKWCHFSKPLPAEALGLKVLDVVHKLWFYPVLKQMMVDVFKWKSI